VFIYIDESGSFVSAPTTGSWNVVAAVTLPESSRRAVEQAVRTLKAETGTHLSAEVKMNEVTEIQYLKFLDALSRTHLLLFATATDAGVNRPDIVTNHQSSQVEKILRNVPLMKYEGGRQGVQHLASLIQVLSPQLYVQLVCQVDLLHAIITRSINYYAQRIPSALGKFRWRIDQKNTSKVTFEEAFETVAPALLQTRSLREPSAQVHGFDYRHFQAYKIPEGGVPQYLQEQTTVKIEHALNIQKLIREDLKFEDSKNSIGVQVADLLASGLRRCLRGRFNANPLVAQALGKLTLQNQHRDPPIHLVSFSQNENEADTTASNAVKQMIKACRPMILSR